MTYATPLLRLSWLFAVGGTDEIAETALNFASAGWDEADATTALAAMDDDDGEALGMALINVLANSACRWADYSDYIALKAAALDTDGHYITDPRLFETYSASGNDTDILPQGSLVISLRSSSSLGRGNYGRMYLPHTSAILETGTPRMESASASTISGLFATFIGDVKDVTEALPGTPTPLIMSRFGAGVNKVITRVGCGRVVDTQRRRRAQLDEDTQFANVPA